MEYQLYKRTKYLYWCRECGNEFTREYELDYPPYRCNVCNETDTFSESEIEVEEINQYCPICESFFKTSDYLNDIMEDERVRWIANMVTHYRHDHLSSWDNTWGRKGYGRRFLSPEVYEDSKRKVNERAKRQILRKCKDYMVSHGFHVEDVMGLQNTDSKTLELYEKVLGYRKLVS